MEPPLSPRAAVDHAAAFNATGSIPRILHQNYMGGPQQLLADALRPLSHFRKEWWRSCQTHHPGWVHMLWDAAACEQLLHQHYPWFLDTWRALGNSTVLKSGVCVCVFVVWDMSPSSCVPLQSHHSAATM